MFYYAIRGATTTDENTPQQILGRTTILLKSLIDRNKIDTRDIISVIFTGTRDLNAVYPAVAGRSLGKSIPLFCCQEMYVEGSLDKCIRILMHIQSQEVKNIKHVYLENAKTLRPDLCKDKTIGNVFNPPLTIAIDGPAGAGKSTISRIVSDSLGIIHLDTGAMYRAVAYKVINQGAGLGDVQEILKILDFTDIRIQHDGGIQKILLDGCDVTPQLRTSEIARAASSIGLIPEVRIRLAEMQRFIADSQSLVMDGRDIGTYVLPNASLKFYLTASLSERAQRRWSEMGGKEGGQDFESIKEEIEKRDYNDENRSFAPLVQAENAILVDTTSKSINEVSTQILNHINQHLLVSREGE